MNQIDSPHYRVRKKEEEGHDLVLKDVVDMKKGREQRTHIKIEDKNIDYAPR